MINKNRIIISLFITLICLAVWLFFLESYFDGTFVLCTLSAISIFCLYLAYKDFDIFRPSFVILVVMWLYHLPCYLFQKEILLGIPSYFWKIAGYYSVICFFCALLGYRLFSFLYKPNKNTTMNVIIQKNFSLWNLCYKFGIGFALLFFIFYMSIFSLNYFHMLKYLIPIMHLTGIISLLLTLGLNINNDKKLIISTMIQMIIFCSLLIVGMRGPALYCTLPFVFSLAKYRPKLKKTIIIMGVVLITIIIPFIKYFRLLNSDLGNNKGFEFDALAGFYELGSTAAMVGNTISNYSIEKYEIKLGTTYIYPIYRLGVRLLSDSILKKIGCELDDLTQEPFAYASQCLEYGGGSIIGETFYNFSYLGSFIFCLFGFLLGYLDVCYKNNGKINIIYALMFEPILEIIRGFFYGFPFVLGPRIFVIINLILLYKLGEKHELQMV